MRKLSHAIRSASWLLGVLALLAAVVLKLAPSLESRFNVSARGGIIISIALFLCALASREVEGADSA
jgi:hypothetical protein